MKDLNQPSIIFSIREERFPDSDNRTHHANYTTSFQTAGLAFRSLLGCCNGQCEEIFLFLDTPFNRAFVLAIAKLHRQTSILLLDAERNAKLLFLNLNTSKSIGVFREVSKRVALKSNNWTFDPDREIFYVAD